MEIKFDCVSCGQTLSIDEAGAGLTIDCPKCGLPVVVPSPPKTIAPAKVQTSPPVPPAVNDKDTKKCPFCDETIKKGARVCRFCGRDLVPPLTHTAEAAQSNPPASSQGRKKTPLLVAVALVILAIIVGAVVLKQQRSVPDSFKREAREFLAKADRLTLATSAGVNYSEYKENALDVISSFRTLSETWPVNGVVGQFKLGQAVEYWAGSLVAWQFYDASRTGDMDTFNQLREQVSHFLARAETDYPALESEVKEGDQSRYASILMTAASLKYAEGRQELLPSVKE